MRGEKSGISWGPQWFSTSSSLQIKKFNFEGILYFTTEVCLSTVLLQQTVTFLSVPSVCVKTNSCCMSRQMSAVIVFPAKEESPFYVFMHIALPPCNFQAVSHLLINYLWLLLSQYETVVPVYVTIHLEGYLICVHHLQ